MSSVSSTEPGEVVQARSSPPDDLSRARLLKLVLSLALVALVLLVYWPCFQFPFLYYDDPRDIFENPHVRARPEWRKHPLGIHQRAWRTLAPVDLAVVATRNRTVRHECRTHSSDQCAAARGEHSGAVSGFLPDDGGHLAQRDSGGPFRFASAQCGIGRLGHGAQEHAAARCFGC